MTVLARSVAAWPALSAVEGANPGQHPVRPVPESPPSVHLNRPTVVLAVQLIGLIVLYSNEVRFPGEDNPNLAMLLKGDSLAVCCTLRAQTLSPRLGSSSCLRKPTRKQAAYS